MSKYLEQLSPEEAKSLLRLLSKENSKLAARIEELAKAKISDVDAYNVADDVYRVLVSIDVEDLWNRPNGSNRFRYVEPVEAAYEMVEEALEPFAEQLKKYRKLAMYQEMKRVGLGIANGILKFTKEGHTEFKEWAPDDAMEWLGGLLMEWEKGCTDENEKECIREMNQLLEG